MLFALLALADATAQAYPEPLTPAGRGEVQCYAPTDHKTCASIAGYVANGDGTFANNASVMLSKQPFVVMQTTTPVSIRGGAVCGVIHSQDIIGGSLRINGQAVPPDKAAPLLTRIAASLDQVIGHEICTVYTPDGNDVVARATMDGKAQPAQDQKVIWVAPADGYTVAP